MYKLGCNFIYISKYSWGLTLDTGSSQVIVMVSSSKAPASSTPCGRMQYVVTQTTDHLTSSFAFFSQDQHLPKVGDHVSVLPHVLPHPQLSIAWAGHHMQL